MPFSTKKEIQDAAYYIWLNRGHPVGQDIEIWKEAEKVLSIQTNVKVHLMRGDLSVEIVHEAQISELLAVSPQFSFLKSKPLPENETIQWNMNGKTAFCLQIIFIGKTGYGKSTTLNKICGYRYFETNDVESCTKKLLSCEFKISETRGHYFSLCDLPGIGESIALDKKYINLYVEMLKKSACVVYVLRADQRDFSVDEDIINTIIKNSEKISSSFVVGLNYADKIEPVSRISPFVPNREQVKNINKKIRTISRIFDMNYGRIVCYSASDGYNLDRLKEAIADAVKSDL
jgi:predicted GTPase